MGTATAMMAATAGLMVISGLAGLAVLERSPVPARVPVAGSRVAEADSHQSGSTVLRADGREVRRVLAHAAR